jgi:hypothetical protein
MRCSCCNKALSDFESTLRHRHTGEFLDTCTKCLKGLSIPTKGRADLRHKEEAQEMDFSDASYELDWDDVSTDY